MNIVQNLTKMIPRTAIPIGNKEIAVLTRMLLGNLTGEQPIREFEQDLANYLGAQKVLAFNSGRTALSTALKALDLKPKTEVLVPAYTCAIVFEVILRLGLKVVPVDVDPGTYNINPDHISKLITPRTEVIIPIHLFGQPCRMDKILEIAKKHNLFVIEDVAQALGVTYKKTKAGTIGDMAIFSFGPGKSMTSGEGGAIAVNNSQFRDKVTELQEKLQTPDLNWNLTVVRNIIAMKTLSNQSLYRKMRGRVDESLLRGDEAIVENCINSAQQGPSAELNPTVKMAKMPAVSAEIARIQLRKLDNLNEKRRTNAAELHSLLGELYDLLAAPKIDSDVEHTFTRFAVRVLKGSREGLMKRLLERGIDTEKPYFYLPKVLEAFDTKPPVTIALAQSALTLPVHPLVESSDLIYMANALTSDLRTLPAVD